MDIRLHVLLGTVVYKGKVFIKTLYIILSIYIFSQTLILHII